MRGRIVTALQDSVLSDIGGRYPHLASVPVCFAPSRELNAFAISAPDGSPIVILNHCIIAAVPHIVTSFLSYSTWDSDEPFSRTHSRATYLASLIALARFVISRDIQHWSRVCTFGIPGTQAFNQFVMTLCIVMEQFILLHEYGHIVLSHLKTDSTVPLRFNSAALRVFTKSQEQEFEADRFATEQLFNLTAMPLPIIPYAIGLLFKFFELVETISGRTDTPDNASHPSASDRLAAITRSLSHVDWLKHGFDDTEFHWRPIFESFRNGSQA